MSQSNAPAAPDAPPAAPAAPQGKGKGKGRRKRILRTLAIVFVVVALLALLYWLLFLRNEEFTDNAYVAGNLIQITPQAAGTVTAIMADDTQLVRQGQPLVQLDAADAEVAFSQAEAGLADAVRATRGLFVGRSQAQALIAQRGAEIERAQSEAARARIDLERAQEDYTRRQSLLAEQAVSQEEVQHAKQALEAARSAVQSAQSARDAALAMSQQAKEQLAAANVQVDNLEVANHPRVLQAAGRLKEAFLARARARIVAPATGYVVKRSVQVGQRVAPGAPLMSVVPLDAVWVDANFKESQLARVRIGQPVKLNADVYGGSVAYDGVVAGLGAGTGGSLSLLPAQNATGNWIKIVQRVPVRIALKPEQLKQHPLRVGLSMRATVDVQDTNGAMLAQDGAAATVQSTTVFDAQARAADALIASIIAANRGPAN